MIKICFVCLGNICRSPMAEFIMKDKIKKLNLEDKYYIESRATSYEEEGNDMHIGAKEILNLNNISYTKHKAKRLEIDDYQKFIIKYPQFEGILRSYLDVDLEKVILRMARSRKFDLRRVDMDGYREFDEVTHKKLEKILR